MTLPEKQLKFNKQPTCPFYEWLYRYSAYRLYGPSFEGWNSGSAGLFSVANHRGGVQGFQTRFTEQLLRMIKAAFNSPLLEIRNVKNIHVVIYIFRNVKMIKFAINVHFDGFWFRLRWIGRLMGLNEAIFSGLVFRPCLTKMYAWYLAWGIVYLEQI